MKTLIIDVYRFVYRISGAKGFSVIIAVIYLTILNMVMLYGLGALMVGWMPTKFIASLFVFPYYFLTAGLMLFLTIKYKPTKKAIAKEAKKTKDYTFIIVYSLAALILFLFMKYGSKINFDNRKLNVKPRKRPIYTESSLPAIPNGWYVILKNDPGGNNTETMLNETASPTKS